MLLNSCVLELPVALKWDLKYQLILILIRDFDWDAEQN